MNTRDQKSIPAVTEADHFPRDVLDSRITGTSPALAGMTASERTKHQLEVADYIQAMCADLRAMAQAAELDGLAYFIDMARIEASTQVESRRDVGRST